MRLAIVAFLAFLMPAFALAGSRDDFKTAFEHKDYKTAIKLLHSLADQGDAEAQDAVGTLYLVGEAGLPRAGIKQNYAEAMKWFRKAADQGYSEAQYDVGGMYSNGWGVPKDYVDALKWYRMAAEQRNAAAQKEVALAYQNGNGTKQDYVEAYIWWVIAGGGTVRFYGTSELEKMMTADQIAGAKLQAAKWMAAHWKPTAAPNTNNILKLLDVSPAPANAKPYSAGLGVNHDYTEEVKRYRESADQGFLPAQKELAEMYWSGSGVSKDYSEAMKWYRKAAEQGDAYSQSALGTGYSEGWGEKPDMEEAYFWHSLAATNGNAFYVVLRELDVLHLSPSQIAALNKRVEDWKTNHSQPPASTAKPETK